MSGASVNNSQQISSPAVSANPNSDDSNNNKLAATMNILLDLDRRFRAVVSNSGDQQISPASNDKIKACFTKDGIVQVRLESGQIKKLDEVLARFMGADVRSMLSSYRTSTALMAGGGISYWLLRRIGSSFAPWVGILIAGLSVADAVSVSIVRDFAAQFDAALDFYHEAQNQISLPERDQKLNDAKGRLSSFGLDSNGKIQHNFELPQILLDSAILLYAKIFFETKDPTGYSILIGLKNTTKDPLVKAMCIAAQIEMLVSKNAVLRFRHVIQDLPPEVVRKHFSTNNEDSALSSFQINVLISALSRQLRREHPQMLDFYFQSVSGAFAKLLEVNTELAFGDRAQAQAAKNKLKCITSFKEIGVLHHMGAKGQYAVLSFNFAQGLAWEMHDAIQERVPLESKHEFYALANAKFRECDTFIKAFDRYGNTPEENELLNLIANSINNRLNARQIAFNAEAERQRSLLPLYTFTQEISLEQQVTDATRDVGYVSPAARDALERSFAAELRYRG